MADYATLLRDRVALKNRSIDRIFLQAYVPKLQTVGLVCRFLRWQRGFPIPSSAAFGQIGQAYVKAVHRFADDHKIPVIHFKKGQNKEQVARPLIEAAARQGGEGQVVLIGIAQEKASAWRSWKAKGQERLAHPHMEWGRQMAHVNHFYFYLWDPDWGGAFWKTNAYAPCPIWIWLNGHEWAKRQLEKADIGYEALDNGFRSCADPVALQRVCDRLGAGAVKSFFWRWLRRLPSPFTPSDLRSGYVYDMAFQVTRPSMTDDGLYAPGLRFGDPRVMAVLAVLAGFCHLVRGFTNAQLVRQARDLLGHEYSTRQATYDLRRLARKGLIARIAGSRRYQLTSTGRRVAVLFTKVYGRVLAPGLTALDQDLPEGIAQRSRLAAAWRGFRRELDRFVEASMLGEAA